MVWNVRKRKYEKWADNEAWMPVKLKILFALYIRKYGILQREVLQHLII